MASRKVWRRHLPFLKAAHSEPRSFAVDSATEAGAGAGVDDRMAQGYGE